MLSLLYYLINSFCEATEAASSAPSDAVSVLSSAEKELENNDDKYQSIIIIPNARNIIIDCDAVLYGTT